MGSGMAAALKAIEFAKRLGVRIVAFHCIPMYQYPVYLGSVTLKTLTLTHLPILVDRPSAGEISHAQTLMEQSAVEP
ncbi:hypothetical protein [Rhodoferax sp.]|uniref:hypothetical protein n=1 Tax=Rhodoferax sp. TaxID=50421 RepID=UPI00276001CA|nr:hypothetical protein [Rhodoferax sp.]